MTLQQIYELHKDKLSKLLQGTLPELPCSQVVRPSLSSEDALRLGSAFFRAYYGLPPLPLDTRKINLMSTPIDNIKTTATGAVRSKDADDVRFDLISPIGLRRLAETYAEGSKKYGDRNWLKGFKQTELLNHALRHVNMYNSGDRSEDHLAHAVWNLLTMMHFEETRPDMCDLVDTFGKLTPLHPNARGLPCTTTTTVSPENELHLWDKTAGRFVPVYDQYGCIQDARRIDSLSRGPSQLQNETPDEHLKETPPLPVHEDQPVNTTQTKYVCCSNPNLFTLDLNNQSVIVDASKHLCVINEYSEIIPIYSRKNHPVMRERFELLPDSEYKTTTSMTDLQPYLIYREKNDQSLHFAYTHRGDLIVRSSCRELILPDLHPTLSPPGASIDVSEHLCCITPSKEIIPIYSSIHRPILRKDFDFITDEKVLHSLDAAKQYPFGILYIRRNCSTRPYAPAYTFYGQYIARKGMQPYTPEVNTSKQKDNLYPQHGAPGSMLYRFVKGEVSPVVDA